MEIKTFVDKTFSVYIKMDCSSRIYAQKIQNNIQTEKIIMHFIGTTAGIKLNMVMQSEPATILENQIRVV